jgi:hypothetical protein
VHAATRRLVGPLSPGGGPPFTPSGRRRENPIPPASWRKPMQGQILPVLGGVRDKVKMKSSARVFTLDDLLSQKLPFYIARHSNACWQGMNDGSCIWKPLDNSC